MFVVTNTFSQVGIGNTDPKATLDITATNATGTTTNVDGLTIPKVTRERAQSMTAINIPIATMIYVTEVTTGTATGTTINVTAAGIYFWDGAAWQSVKSSKSATTTTSLIMQETLSGSEGTNLGLYGFTFASWLPSSAIIRRTLGSYSDGVYFSSTTAATTLTNISLNGFLSNTGGSNGSATIYIVKYSLGTTGVSYSGTVTGTSLGTQAIATVTSGNIYPINITVPTSTSLAAGDVIICVIVNNSSGNRTYEFTGQLQCTQ